MSICFWYCPGYNSISLIHDNIPLINFLTVLLLSLTVLLLRTSVREGAPIKTLQQLILIGITFKHLLTVLLLSLTVLLLSLTVLLLSLTVLLLRT